MRCTSHLAKAKVSELEKAICIEETVLRLKVTVDYVVRVQVLQRLNHTGHVEASGLLPEWTSRYNEESIQLAFGDAVKVTGGRR